MVATGCPVIGLAAMLSPKGLYRVMRPHGLKGRCRAPVTGEIVFLASVEAVAEETGVSACTGGSDVMSVWRGGRVSDMVRFWIVGVKGRDN